MRGQNEKAANGNGNNIRQGKFNRIFSRPKKSVASFKYKRVNDVYGITRAFAGNSVRSTGMLFVSMVLLSDPVEGIAKRPLLRSLAILFR